jgi:hypothetical protein
VKTLRCDILLQRLDQIFDGKDDDCTACSAMARGFPLHPSLAWPLSDGIDTTIFRAAFAEAYQ